jgi:hypothetical protein
MRRAIRAGLLSALTMIKVDRSLVSSRNDPRYDALLRELKLPE